MAQTRPFPNTRAVTRELLLSCLVLALLGQQVFAAWAAHFVISPASLAAQPKDPNETRFAAEATQLARGVTVRPTADGRVSIELKATENEHKGYYLIVSKKRLAPDDLDLRSVLRPKNLFDFGAKDASRPLPKGFVEVRPLQSNQTNGESVIEIILDRKTALKSYVAWDFRSIYEDGAMIRDGGLWLTYDLPAFVEVSQKP